MHTLINYLILFVIYFQHFQCVPTPPRKPLIMGFTSRSVNLTWNESHNRDDHTPITHYIIQIRVGENGEWHTNNSVATLDNKSNYYLDGLKPFTVYSFRVLAVNANGTSDASKQSYYMVTLREVPEGKPTITRVDSASSSSIRVEWTPPHSNTIHGEFLGYRIAYRKHASNLGEESEITLKNPDLRSFIIKNLEPFTEYMISLQILNPVGYGPVTNITATTDDGRYDYESPDERNRASLLKTQNNLRMNKMLLKGREIRDTNTDKQSDKFNCTQIFSDVLFPSKEVFDRCLRGEMLPRVFGKNRSGVFGFFINRHFFHCKPPSDSDIKTKITATGEEIYIIPPNKKYYHRCQYYDENPTRKEERRIGEKGLNGTFGYFERGIFMTCDLPKSVDQILEFDPKLNNSAYVYIIPYKVSLEYPSKCEYFDENPGNKYNYNETQISGTARSVYNMFHPILQLLSLIVLI